MNDNDWNVYDLKVFKYKECVYCRWACNASEGICPKCRREMTSTMSFIDIVDEQDVKRLFTEQKEWVATNNPSEEKKKEAFQFALDLYNIKFL